MRKLLNTLYITSPDSWLFKDGENIVVKIGGSEKFRIPFHNVESIVSFGHAGASPSLMAACAERNIGLSFLSESGRFLARTIGKTNGNVLVRRRQYRLADSPDKSLRISSIIVAGKISNSRKILERHTRDYPCSDACAQIKEVSKLLLQSRFDAINAKSQDALLGVEGNASKLYFSVFNNLILNKDGFYFCGRNRRPPKDRVNALLSFAYTLLAHDVQSALESVGLDSYVGFFHKDRPGRAGLALDIMEELRAYIADRCALNAINLGQIRHTDFIDNGENGVVLKPDARKEFITLWQKRKRDEIEHPYLREKIMVGLIPYAQAMLMNKYIRDELEDYPVFVLP